MWKFLKVLLAVGLGFVALAGCAHSAVPAATSPDADANPWPDGRAFVSTGVTEAGADRPLVAGTQILIRFRQRGELVTQAGCNELNIKATITGNTIAPTGYVATAMGCDPVRLAQDDWLLSFFNAHPTWVLTGDVLVLRAGDREIRLLDKVAAERPRPLLATRWVVTTAQSATGTSSSVPAGVAYLVFSATNVIGQTGCSGVAAEVSYPDGVPSTAGRVVVAAVHRSSIPCEGAAQDLDVAVMAALQGTVIARLDGANLTLTAAYGAGLVLRADP